MTQVAPTNAQRPPLAILWRRKWIVICTVIIFAGVTEAVTSTLQRAYEATATLIVAQPRQPQFSDTVTADEEAARSFAPVLSSSNFAARVARQARLGLSAKKLHSAVSIAAVPQTQLLTITASDPSPLRAKLIADSYAQTFVASSPRLSNLTGEVVRVADPAPLPTSPSRPKPALYGLVAAILGVAVGIGLALLRERLDVRLRSRDELAAQLNVPVLAAVPVRRGSPQSIEQFAEAFRLLRTNLYVQHGPSSINPIAVTSWEEGEGKTTVVSELAISLAASGTETLIVDADGGGKSAQFLLVRNGDERLERGLTDYCPGGAELGEATGGTHVSSMRLVGGTEILIVHADGRGKSAQSLPVNNADDRLEPGLTDYALGDADLQEAIHDTRVSAVRLMPLGRSVPSLSNLLHTRVGRDAFDRLQDERGAVVVDCPALTRGADAPTIASRAAGVVLVVDLSRATVPALHNAMRNLEAVNARLLGIVVNHDRRVRWSRRWSRQDR
jgi:capsular polysaccharide biosynthesis protein/MinD-like ATPase involved in chromosome partitioning or flagellar assembly